MRITPPNNGLGYTAYLFVACTCSTALFCRAQITLLLLVVLFTFYSYGTILCDFLGYLCVSRRTIVIIRKYCLLCSRFPLRPPPPFAPSPFLCNSQSLITVPECVPYTGVNYQNTLKVSVQISTPCRTHCNTDRVLSQSSTVLHHAHCPFIRQCKNANKLLGKILTMRYSAQCRFNQAYLIDKNLEKVRCIPVSVNVFTSHGKTKGADYFISRRIGLYKIALSMKKFHSTSISRRFEFSAKYVTSTNFP